MRASGWREEDASGHSKAPPPSAFSQDTPTHSANGQRVVQPVPVEMARKENGATSQNAMWSGAMCEDPSTRGPSQPLSLGYSSQSAQMAVQSHPLLPQTTVQSHPPLSQTTVPSQPPLTQPPPQFQTSYVSHAQPGAPGNSVTNQPFNPQHSGPPSGIQPSQNAPPAHSECM